MSFRKMGLFVLGLSLCVLANDAFAQPGGRGGFGRMGFGGGSMGLLQNKDVQQKLDLSDDQIGEIKEISEEMQSKVREAMQDRDFQALRGIMEDSQGEVSEVLLKTQQQMLTKIMNQQRYIRNGQLRISQDFLVEQLGMSEGDAEKAMEDYEKQVEKFRKKVAEAAEEMMADFKKGLSKDAKAKFEEMFGEELIQIQPPERPQFGGRGGRGGAGGRGPGGRGGRGGDGGRRGGGDDF